jgi:hypothetical protein
VVIAGGTRGQRGLDGEVLTVIDEQVGEEGLVAADEGKHPEPEVGTDTQRQRADELSVPIRDMDGEPAVVPVLTPPLQQPAVQQHGARPRHRPDEVVPFPGHPDEGDVARNRAECQLAWSGGRAHT